MRSSDASMSALARLSGGVQKGKLMKGSMGTSRRSMNWGAIRSCETTNGYFVSRRLSSTKRFKKVDQSLNAGDGPPGEKNMKNWKISSARQPISRESAISEIHCRALERLWWISDVQQCSGGDQSHLKLGVVIESVFVPS